MSIEQQLSFFLISLEEDSERRFALAQRFPSYYKKFKRIDAVDGRKLSAQEYFYNTLDFERRHRRMMTPAELGCALSHVKALEAFLKVGGEYAFIVEDDINGSDSDIEKVISYLSEMNSNSLLFCGCQDGLMNRYKYGYKIVEGLLRVPSSNVGNFSRTAAYVISKSAAKKVLEFQKNRITVADYWFELLSNVEVSIFYAKGISHPVVLDGSLIEKERLLFKKSILRKLLSRKSYSSGRWAFNK